MVGAWQQVAGTVTRVLNCRHETGKWTWDAIMNTQACSSDISSSNTVLKPPQILPPTGEQAFKYLSLWGTYLLKLLHSTCWATWYQQLSLVPEELSACMCVCLWVCVYMCVMSSWGCQSLLYDTTLFLWNMVSPWIRSRVHVFLQGWHSVGPSCVWALQCWNYKHAWDYSQFSVVLESEVWFLYLYIVHSNHGAISPTKSFWLENALYFCLLH